MTSCEEAKLSCVQRFAVSVVKSGPVPKHVAFIMDGNRRYAKKGQIAIEVGHSKGLETLDKVSYFIKHMHQLYVDNLELL